MFKKSVRLIALLLVLALSIALVMGCSEEAPPDDGGDGGDGGGEGEEPLKIGFLVPLTGNFAANGVDMRDGLRMWLNEHDWEIAGRPVELLIEDTEGNPATALVKAKKLWEMNQVDLLTGPLSAASGIAVAQYAVENNIPLLDSIVSADDLTQRTRSDYVLRTGWSSSQPTHVLGEYAYNELGYRKVVTIAYDFAFGHETIGGFHYTFEELGGEVLNKMWPPIGTPDYGPYLSQIPEDVDAVVANFSGADALRFVQQYQQFGLKDKIPLIAAGTLTDEHILVSMGDEALGIISALHYSAGLDSPEAEEFIASYRQNYGRVPSYYAEGTYTSMAVLEAGLEAVGSLDDMAAFNEAVRELEIVSPRGTFTIDEYNNPVQNVYIREVERVDGELQNTVIKTYENISQFYTYDAEEFLSRPVYSRDFPPLD